MGRLRPGYLWWQPLSAWHSSNNVIRLRVSRIAARATSLALPGGGLETGRSHDRQRSELRSKLFVDASRARPPPQDQGRAPDLKRLRPRVPLTIARGVLAVGVQPLAGAEDHRAPPRPPRERALLQHRPRPHGPPHLRLTIDDGQRQGWLRHREANSLRAEIGLDATARLLSPNLPPPNQLR